MLVTLNIKNDNETYRVPCPSPSPIIPRHAIDSWGPLRPSVRQLSGAQIRRRRRVTCSPARDEVSAGR